MRSIAMMTMVVESVSSLYFFAPFSFGSQGQEAFWSSLLTSLMKFLVLANIAAEEDRENEEEGDCGSAKGSELVEEVRLGKRTDVSEKEQHGGRESNPQ